MAKVHAPPSRGYTVGAFCRYVAYATIAALPEDVTCRACLVKMEKRGVPRKGWAPLSYEQAWGKPKA